MKWQMGKDHISGYENTLAIAKEDSDKISKMLVNVEPISNVIRDFKR